MGVVSVGSLYSSIQAEGGRSFTLPLPTLVPSLDSPMLQFPHPVPFLRPGMVVLWMCLLGREHFRGPRTRRSAFHGHFILIAGPRWRAVFWLGEAIRKALCFLSSPPGQVGPNHPKTDKESAGKTVLAFSSPPFAFLRYQGLKLNTSGSRGLQSSTGFGASQTWVQNPTTDTATPIL